MTTLNDDVLVEHMRKHGMPITRENYVRLNYGAEPPLDWTLEHELELPDELQNWTWIAQHYPGFFGDQDQPEGGVAEDAGWNEQAHPRGQPKNRGEFAKGGSRASPKAAPTTPAAGTMYAPRAKASPKSAAAASSPAAPTNDPHTEAAYNIRQLVRHLSMGAAGQAAALADVRNTYAAVAKTLGMPPEDPNYVVDGGPSPTFMLNGKKYNSAGQYNVKTGVATIYTQTPRHNIDLIPDTMAHELMHKKAHAVLDAFDAEVDGMMGDYAKVGAPLLPGAPVPPQLKGKYPIHEALEPNRHNLLDTDALHADDGVTPYSTQHWKSYTDGRNPSPMLAVHETLAEMSRLDWEGKLRNSPWYQQSNGFRPLYEAINSVYPTLVKTKT